MPEVVLPVGHDAAWPVLHELQAGRAGTLQSYGVNLWTFAPSPSLVALARQADTSTHTPAALRATREFAAALMEAIADSAMPRLRTETDPDRRGALRRDSQAALNAVAAWFDERYRDALLELARRLEEMQRERDQKAAAAAAAADRAERLIDEAVARLTAEIFPETARA